MTSPEEGKPTASAAPETKAPVIAFKKRRGKGESSIRKRPATPPPASDSEFETSSEDEETGQRVKRRKTKGAGITAGSSTAPGGADRDLFVSIAAADRTKSLSASNDATKENTLEVDGAAAGPGRIGRLDGSAPDGTYKGLANQTKFFQTNPNAPSRAVGPVKAPTNVRTVTVIDYAPDVCKDYKQTGFCGFGDNCKFLHSREDYKQGWQLDKEWETVTKGKQVGGTVVASADRTKLGDADEDEDDDDDPEDDIPFACVICKQPYKSPVVTRCGHYFCESCALKRYRTNPSCAACGAGTGGVFNVARKLKKAAT